MHTMMVTITSQTDIMKVIITAKMTYKLLLMCYNQGREFRVDLHETTMGSTVKILHFQDR